MGLKIDFPFTFPDGVRCTVGVELWGLEEEEYDAGVPLTYERLRWEAQAFPDISSLEDVSLYQTQQEALERRLKEQPEAMQRLAAMVLRALVIECHRHRDARSRVRTDGGAA